MFRYYLRLGAKSIMKQPILSALMMLAVGLGIGVCMTMFSLYHTLSADPIPHKSSHLYAVRIDAWDPEEPANEDKPDLPPYQLTWMDTMALLESDVPTRHVGMHKSFFSLNMEHSDVKPFGVVARMTSKDFFDMFDVPFLYGTGWDEQSDAAGQPVAVISRETNDKVFGGENSVGRVIRLDQHSFKVIGVLDTWAPKIKYYDMNNGPVQEPEDVYLPLSLTPQIEARVGGNNNCWKDEEIVGHAGHLQSECIWLQFWAELDNSKQKQAYQNWLDAYATEQKRLGRHGRPVNNHMSDVNEWIDLNDVVTDDLTVLVGLAFLFLTVCLINAIGLLLARFLAKTPVVALRRAVGASSRSIVSQHLVEVALIGLGGGLVGIVFAVIGLSGVRTLMSSMDGVARFSWELSAIAIFIAVASTVIAGLYPTWRICRVPPSTQLKTQ